MIVRFQIDDRTFHVDSGEPIDLSIPLKFNRPQPNAYGVEPAKSEPCRSGNMVGDTRLGGSVNFEQYVLIPHCNGTHTECVGHISNERISVRDCLKDTFVPAVLVSVQPEDVDNEPLLAKAELINAIEGLSSVRVTDPIPSALIVRTLPNDDSKLTRQYGSEIPPYFAAEAMEYIVECGFKHVLVDMPSIDRIFDEGKLINHRIFWNVEPGSFEVNAETRLNNTVTELIYVPNEVADGEYLLNIQIAPFVANASPSRPILFKMH